MKLVSSAATTALALLIFIAAFVSDAAPILVPTITAVQHATQEHAVQSDSSFSGQLKHMGGVDRKAALDNVKDSIILTARGLLREVAESSTHVNDIGKITTDTLEAGPSTDLEHLVPAASALEPSRQSTQVAEGLAGFHAWRRLKAALEASRSGATSHLEVQLDKSRGKVSSPPSSSHRKDKTGKQALDTAGQGRPRASRLYEERKRSQPDPMLRGVPGQQKRKYPASSSMGEDGASNPDQQAYPADHGSSRLQQTQPTKLKDPTRDFLSQLGSTVKQGEAGSSQPRTLGSSPPPALSLWTANKAFTRPIKKQKGSVSLQLFPDL